MHRGVKHKDIANGRKGRVGQRLPCITSTADPDPENNAGGEAAAAGGEAAAVGGEASAVGGEAAAENQHTGLNLNQAKARDSFGDQINKAEAVLALKGELKASGLMSLLTTLWKSSGKLIRRAEEES